MPPSFFLLAALLAPAADEARPKHWSLRPRTQPAVPVIRNPQSAIRNPVDAFILARLEKEGLRQAPEADRRTLARRLYFDLTGLPPTPHEIDAFMSDPAPDAYERLVERLLASPRYGEKWGRHWLDAVRFAETEGFEYDRLRPGAWRYRDYVINAFNRDKPYDRFILEQLAGDEIEPQNPEMQVAAGFHRLGPVRRNAGNQELAFSRHEVLTEMTDAVGAVFLGLTVGCARCHDHKFDEISQEDYYCLQAFLAAAQEHDVSLASAKEQAEWKAKSEAIQAEIKRLRKAATGLTGDDRRQMEAKVQELERSLPAPLPTISSVHDVEAQRTPIHVLKRGSTEKKGRQVGPRVPGVLAGDSFPELAADTPNPRTVLARWIARPEHPLTARVMVNRIWQGHFGRGLVATANDFGVNGSAPSHPELLDWLASELIASGWQIKPIHRLIVLSGTYRQASDHPEPQPGLAKDDDNRLLWRFPRRRLTAEEVRDSMLLLADRLNGKMAGPSVVVPVDPDLVQLLYAPAQWTVTPDRAEHDRRSVYLLAKRNLRLPFLEAFDQPDAQTSCARRESSTHALQALELLNGKLANDLAAGFAQRLRREAGADSAALAERAYLLAAGRLPSTREKTLAIEFLKTHALSELALAVFNLNAFLYVK
jgi:hypothetical protein